MKSIAASWLLLPLALGLFSACDVQEETVETAYVFPILPEPSYKFSRNGYSNVDVLECGFLKQTLDYIYSGFLREASISTPTDHQNVLQRYKEGEFGVQPAAEVALSPRQSAHRDVVGQDLLNLIEASAKISGYPLESPYPHRNRPAQMGQSGFVGHDIGDANKFFIDEQGLAPAEVFRFYVMGAIYLDKILGEHLDDRHFINPRLLREHQNVQLVRGRNYTQLEHHLDLAYGYYKHWQGLAHAEGLPILKDSDHKIFIALVQARTLLQYYRYDEVLKQIAIVREELSKVVPARAMNLLVGVNTIANIEERPEHAFDFLSQAIGLIRCLPFTLRPDGKPYFTYEEAQQLVTDLLQGKGLWESQRLLGDEQQTGSLRNIASRVGRPFNISLQDIQR